MRWHGVAAWTIRRRSVRQGRRQGKARRSLRAALTRPWGQQRHSQRAKGYEKGRNAHLAHPFSDWNRIPPLPRLLLSDKTLDPATAKPEGTWTARMGLPWPTLLAASHAATSSLYWLWPDYDPWGDSWISCANLTLIWAGSDTEPLRLQPCGRSCDPDAAAG